MLNVSENNTLSEGDNWPCLLVFVPVSSSVFAGRKTNRSSTVSRQTEAMGMRPVIKARLVAHTWRCEVKVAKLRARGKLDRIDLKVLQSLPDCRKELRIRHSKQRRVRLKMLITN